MHEVHLGKLWTGHALDLRTPRPLFELGIGAVVDLAYEEVPAQLPRQIIYCRFPIFDGEGNEPVRLLLALQTIVDLLHADVPLLVGCSAGMSRSPTFAAAALAILLKESPEDVLQRLSTHRALDVSGPLWNDITNVMPGVRRH